MQTPSIVLCLAVLLTSVTAQDDSRIAAQAVQTYIAALPNATACDMAFSDVLSPVNLTEAHDQYNTALQTFCSVDCGSLNS